MSTQNKDEIDTLSQNEANSAPATKRTFNQSTTFDIFQTVTGMNKLLETIVMETNRYATQKGCNFETTKYEMKAFLRANFMMGINKLSYLEDY